MSPGLRHAGGAEDAAPDRGATRLLDVRDLRVSFRTEEGLVRAVDGVSFSLHQGEVLGIVGESGCGKSVTCLTIMGLNPKASTISSGEVLFNGEEILHAPGAKLRDIRGNRIAMIHGASRMYCRPSAMMLPQVGVGGTAPRPRKLSVASESTA